MKARAAATAPAAPVERVDMPALAVGGECPVCLDEFQASIASKMCPIVAPCGHTLCRQCLSALCVRSSPGTGLQFTCPLCKRVAPLRESELPSTFGTLNHDAIRLVRASKSGRGGSGAVVVSLADALGPALAALANGHTSSGPADPTSASDDEAAPSISYDDIWISLLTRVPMYAASHGLIDCPYALTLLPRTACPRRASCPFRHERKDGALCPGWSRAAVSNGSKRPLCGDASCPRGHPHPAILQAIDCPEYLSSGARIPPAHAPLCLLRHSNAIATRTLAGTPVALCNAFCGATPGNVDVATLACPAGDGCPDLHVGDVLQPFHPPFDFILSLIDATSTAVALNAMKRATEVPKRVKVKPPTVPAPTPAPVAVPTPPPVAPVSDPTSTAGKANKKKKKETAAAAVETAATVAPTPAVVTATATVKPPTVTAPVAKPPTVAPTPAPVAAVTKPPPTPAPTPAPVTKPPSVTAAAPTPAVTAAPTSTAAGRGFKSGGAGTAKLPAGVTFGSGVQKTVALGTGSARDAQRLMAEHTGKALCPEPVNIFAGKFGCSRGSACAAFHLKRCKKDIPCKGGGFCPDNKKGTCAAYHFRPVSVCTRWQATGACSYGDECTFLHCDPRGLGFTADAPPSAPAPAVGVKPTRPAAAAAVAAGGAAGGPPGDASGPTFSWQCPVCTLENDVLDDACQVCDTQRPAHVRSQVGPRLA